jgi:nitroreductase
MDIPVSSWYNAIFQRHSRRKYTGVLVPDESLDSLEELSKTFKPFKGARSLLLRSASDRVFRGIIGSYGAVKNAPHYFAIIGDMTEKHVQEAAGYHGEALVLAATSKGIDTCWIGGFFRPEVVSSELEMEDHEKVLAVIPIGYAAEEKTKIERAMSELIGSHRRRAVNDLLYLGSEDPSGWASKAIEAARLAPSAVNRQPWRFNIAGKAVEIYAKNGNSLSSSISPRLDCGIAMLHLELGALDAGVKGEWQLLDDAPIARYVIS